MYGEETGFFDGSRRISGIVGILILACRKRAQSIGYPQIRGAGVKVDSELLCGCSDRDRTGPHLLLLVCECLRSIRGGTSLKMLGDGLEVLDREAFGKAAKVSLQVA